MPHMANLTPRQNLTILSGAFMLALIFIRIFTPNSIESTPVPTIPPVPSISPDPLPNWMGAVLSSNELDLDDNCKLAEQWEGPGTCSAAEYNMFSETKTTQPKSKHNEDFAPTKGFG